MSEDAQDECQITQAGKDEEQRAEALGTFPAVIVNDLGNACAKVENCTNVAEYLSPKNQDSWARTDWWNIGMGRCEDLGRVVVQNFPTDDAGQEDQKYSA